MVTELSPRNLTGENTLSTQVTSHIPRRGESSRNVQRNNTRNDEALTNLLASVTGVKHSVFFYQFCKNYSCRSVEVIIFDGVQGVDDTVAKYWGHRIGVPVVTIHHDKDELLRGMCDVTRLDPTGEVSEGVGVSWGRVAQWLRGVHVAHENSPEAWRCGKTTYDRAWLPKGRGRGKGATDFSVSNMLRSIPGVRHLDVDAVVSCVVCSEALLVIEASSDGAQGTALADKVKATSMTRKLGEFAQVPTLLIQHRVGDKLRSHPVDLTLWRHGDPTPYSATGRTWEAAQKYIEKLQANHTCPPAHMSA